MDSLGAIQSQPCRCHRVCSGRKSFEWTAANLGGRRDTLVKLGRVDCTRSEHMANLQYPSAAWANWQAPFVPQLVSRTLTMQCAAGQLTDGSLELWALTEDGLLHSTWENSLESTWANWERPFLPNPGVMNDIAVGRLKDGSAQIFVASRPSASGTVQDHDVAPNKERSECQSPGVDALGEHGHRASVIA